MSKMKRLLISLPENLHEWLRRESFKSKVSMSKYIREILMAFVGSYIHWGKLLKFSKKEDI